MSTVTLSAMETVAAGTCSPACTARWGGTATVRRRAAGGSLFGTVTTFGTAVDITVAELSVEAFLPADAVTAEALREAALRVNARSERRPVSRPEGS